jgi:hypothetical protein
MMRILHRYTFYLERMPRGQFSYIGGVVIRQKNVSCDSFGDPKEPFMVKLMVRVKPGARAIPIGPTRGIWWVNEEYCSLAPGVLLHYFNPVPAHERKAVPNPADSYDSTRKGFGIPTRFQALSVLAVLDEACARCHDTAVKGTILQNSSKRLLPNAAIILCQR